METRETNELTTEDVAFWSEVLTEVQERTGPRFACSVQGQRMRRYLDGLLSRVDHKNG